MKKIGINSWWGRRWSSTSRPCGCSLPFLQRQLFSPSLSFAILFFLLFFFILFFNSPPFYTYPLPFLVLPLTSFLLFLFPFLQSAASSFGGDCLLAEQTDRITLTTQDTSKKKYIRGRIVGFPPHTPSFFSLLCNKQTKKKKISKREEKLRRSLALPKKKKKHKQILLEERGKRKKNSIHLFKTLVSATPTESSYNHSWTNCKRKCIVTVFTLPF